MYYIFYFFKLFLQIFIRLDLNIVTLRPLVNGEVNGFRAGQAYGQQRKCWQRYSDEKEAGLFTVG